jgi:7,8-dihydropterin-6-yl-methyl-4-(beta-D-ribofuranosyl)aminobenzene 5'-phosphate synthase
LVLLLVAFVSPDPVIAGDHVTITILYDNTVYNQATTADWGFSCLVEGFDKTVLFDAGASGSILIQNANTLGVSTTNANLVVVSHDHSDHTGGLSAALGSGSKASVYIGNSFSTTTEQMIKTTGATAIRGAAPVNLLPSVQTTGEVQGSVNEQSLIISVDSGLVVIAGCSHPGVIQILDRVKQLLNKNIYMVLGGFHWLDFTDSQVDTLIKQMKDRGVKKCGATHCTGDRAIALIKQAFGSDFVDMGVGRIITLSSTLVGVKQENGLQLRIPQAYSLHQNYPNPFNPATVISYQLPVNSHVMLKVYDLLGREMAILVNEKKDAGRYSVEWDAGRLASDVYFYTLQAGEYRDTKRMLLLK